MNVLAVLFLALFGISSAVYDWDDVTPLDDYVWRDLGADDPYSYEYHQVYEETDYTMYVINMTSQQWMNSTYISPEDIIWYHWMVVVVPTQPKTLDSAMLYITGGNKDDSAPVPEDGTPTRLVNFSRSTGAVAAAVFNVPFQPTTFANDTFGRVEDQIIARTWYLYYYDAPYDPDIVVLLPMVRAARRAVDTLVEVAKDTDANYNITNIMPAGRSKRGWVTWLLAATDRRCFSAVPIVLTMLNWYPNLHHHWQSYEGWSWAFTPYWVETVPQFINTTRGAEIFDDIAIDPLNYNPRLANIPKLAISASGDEFFLSDDANYFWQELAGVKYYQMIENTAHSLSGEPTDRQWKNMANFFWATRYNTDALPDMQFSRQWNEEEGWGSITVVTDRTPRNIQAWWAETTNVTSHNGDNGTIVWRRDFRLRTLTQDNPIVWYPAEVEDLGFNNFRAVFDEPESDDVWKEFWIEVEFAGPIPGDPDLDQLRFTTEVQVIPDVLPWSRCETEQRCQGILR